jgi:hypothetical protein
MRGSCCLLQFCNRDVRWVYTRVTFLWCWTKPPSTVVSRPDCPLQISRHADPKLFILFTSVRYYLYPKCQWSARAVHSNAGAADCEVLTKQTAKCSSDKSEINRVPATRTKYHESYAYTTKQQTPWSRDLEELMVAQLTKIYVSRIPCSQQPITGRS